jgi:Mrp family chromosome partitioning ATPase
VALHHPDHPISEQYRAIVADLERQLTTAQSQALLFTTTDPRIDTAAVLLNVAITHAGQSETPTIVVDADFRRSTLAHRLGLPAAPGLKNVLAGLISLPRAVQETGQPNLYALTAGKTTPDSVPPVPAESLLGALRYLRSRFAWILVNAPCWDGRPEVITLASGCDAVFLVVPEADAQTDSVEAVSQAILQQGGCLQGYILVGDEQ